MTHSSDDLDYWLLLQQIPGIGPINFARLLDEYGQPRSVFNLSATQLQSVGLKTATVEAVLNPDWASIDADRRWRDHDHHHIITLNDDDYPRLLRESAAAPPILYILGSKEVLNQPQLAMVGSRNPTPAGNQTALEFARHLAAAGLTITSGMAIGIDGACHRGALDAGGSTIAVTGTGLDRIYPARHQQLAYEIVETGAIVSEFPIGTPPRAENFPRRNRIISALSLGTLVVEAALRSGSLITARHALEQGREVFAIPNSIHNPLGRGCHHLIRQGAQLVETANDIINTLLPQCETAPQESQATDNYSNYQQAGHENYQLILKEMGYSPATVNNLVERSGLTAEEVSSMMLILELQGAVATSPGGCYIRVK
jgi:DNA processing protein